MSSPFCPEAAARAAQAYTTPIPKPEQLPAWEVEWIVAGAKARAAREIAQGLNDPSEDWHHLALQWRAATHDLYYLSIELFKLWCQARYDLRPSQVSRAVGHALNGQQRAELNGAIARAISGRATAGGEE